MDTETWSFVIRNYAQAFALIAAPLAGAFALWRYVRSERTRQTELVRDFYRMFFEDHRHKHMRRILDDPESAEFAQLRIDLSDDAISTQLEEQMVDYLNFFEFVVGLMHRRMVARSEVDWLFKHFIDRLFAVDFVRTYIQRWGFEELQTECRRALRKNRTQTARPA